MGYVGLQINLLPLPIRDPRMRGGERGGGRNKLLPGFFKDREEISFDPKKFCLARIKRFLSETLHPIPHQKHLMFNSSFSKSLTFKRQSHKMAKHTQTIRWQIADELFECVWPLC